MARRLELVAPKIQPFLNPLFVSVAGGFVVAAPLGKVGLWDESVGVVVGVFVSGVTEPFGAFVMFISKVKWDGEGDAGSDVFSGREDGLVGAVAFWRGSQVYSCLSEGYLAFGLTDKLNGLLSGDGNDECLRVGHADILGCGDHEASGDEADVFTAFEHSGEPVERGVRI